MSCKYQDTCENVKEMCKAIDYTKSYYEYKLLCEIAELKKKTTKCPYEDVEYWECKIKKDYERLQVEVKDLKKQYSGMYNQATDMAVENKKLKDMVKLLDEQNEELYKIEIKLRKENKGLKEEIAKLKAMNKNYLNDKNAIKKLREAK